MALNKKWWVHDSELAADIHTTFRKKEKKLPKYKRQSPQIHCRRFVVDWLALLCNNYDICDTARHLSIALLDYFMEKFDIQLNTIGLVALTSLSLACKFEEHEENIPHLQDLCSHLDKEMLATPQLIWEMEIKMMEFYNFDIGFPTNAHFIDYYLTKGISDGDMHEGHVITARDCAEESLRTYANYFQEISLQSEYYRQFYPSEVAAACIAGSRKCMSIAPVWTADLLEITGYTLGKLKPILQEMLKTHDIDIKATENEKPGKVYHNGGLPLLKIMASWGTLETDKTQMELNRETDSANESPNTKMDTNGNHDNASAMSETDRCEQTVLKSFYFDSYRGRQTASAIAKGHCISRSSNSIVEETRSSQIVTRSSSLSAASHTKVGRSSSNTLPSVGKKASPATTTPDSGYFESPGMSPRMT